MTAVLEVKNLKKIYPGKDSCIAVDNISFHLEEKEILGLVGPNGSGKTTTIQMLLGTLAYSSGSISYFGKELESHRSEILKKVTFASTYASLPWSLTIKENLQVFGLLYGISKKESYKCFSPLLERFGIASKLHSPVSSLSAGQVTRLMLVKAFFLNPRVVLLDEPTASLDPEIANDICSFILEQREKTGLSILFTSHKMAEVMEICDRTIFLKNGKIIANDIPQNLARSIAKFQLKLHIPEGLETAIALVKKENLTFSIDHNNIEITLDEEKIPLLLQNFSAARVYYSHIKIEEPSLENFFLHIAKSPL